MSTAIAPSIPDASREAPPFSSVGGVSSEEHLLLLTAAGNANDRAIRAVATGVVDWNRFLGLAQIERAVSVIYPRFRATAPDLIPGDVLDQMRRLALVSNFAMLHLESRLRESLRALERAGVRVMLLKGAALARTVYAGACERPMADLDLLVDASNAATARRVMLAEGWRDLSRGIPDAVYERHHHSPPLKDTRSPGLQLEIHSALFPERHPFAFDARDLWLRARPLSDASRGTFVPDPLDSLLHACLHFFWSHQARFGVWRTIRDVDAISRRAEMDWDAFVASARAARGGTCCYWTLRIAHAAAGVDVPSRVFDELRPGRPEYLLRAIERHFLANLFPAHTACPSVALDRALWELGVMPRQSGHGDVRPWDTDEAFVVPRDGPGGHQTSARKARMSLLLASTAYIRTLLRSPG